MIAIRSRLTIALAVLLGLVPAAAFAQAGPQTTTVTPATPPDVATLLAQGFEIKSVLLVPADVVHAGGSTDAVPAVMILLQNATVLANCYVTYESYTNGSYYRSPSCYLRQ